MLISWHYPRNQANDLNELKKLQKPSDVIKLIFDCVGLLKMEKVQPVQVDEITIGIGKEKQTLPFLKVNTHLGVVTDRGHKPSDTNTVKEHCQYWYSISVFNTAHTASTRISVGVNLGSLSRKNIHTSECVRLSVCPSLSCVWCIDSHSSAGFVQVHAGGNVVGRPFPAVDICLLPEREGLHERRDSRVHGTVPGAGRLQPRRR